jgi:hypothetical protein
MAERTRVGSEQDRRRINLGLESEVAYWVRTLGVDEGQLRALVSFHGHSVTIIREVLERRKAA